MDQVEKVADVARSFVVGAGRVEGGPPSLVRLGETLGRLSVPSPGIGRTLS